MAKYPHYPMKYFAKKKDRTEESRERCKSITKLLKKLRELKYSERSMLPFYKKINLDK
jgi:hypothetical protein